MGGASFPFAVHPEDGRQPPSHPTDLPQGFWLADYDASDSVVDEAIFPMSAGDPGFGPDQLEVDSTGGLAVGGSFAGEMDLGDGELSSGSGFPMRPFHRRLRSGSRRCRLIELVARGRC
jgi:hypothetical protein